ncbi:MAG: V-type ATPase subunit, partial [Oscillospiraceae bacterium]
AQALEIDAHTLLSGAGTVPVHTIEGIWREKRWHELTPTMRTAALEATDLLARTGDPQLSDLVLDRAMAAQMLTEAQKAESDYLIEYVRLFIDSANLRVVVRAARAQKGFDYLRKAVLPGGNVTADRLVSDLSGEDITTLFAGRDLAAASQAAAWAMEGEVTLAALDMACDNALINYIRTARLIAFGEASVIAYLVAREAELVSVRTIMVGRRAGLSEEQIMERLRMSYV